MSYDHHPQVPSVKTVYFFCFGLVFASGLCFFTLQGIQTGIYGIPSSSSQKEQIVTEIDKKELSSFPISETVKAQKTGSSSFRSKNHLISGDILLEPSSSERSVLMVVAHPDDEALWGGEYLLQEGRKVHVIVTCTQNRNTATRFEEFKRVQEHLGYRGEFLNGKDSIKTTQLESHIEQRVTSLICGKNWEKIITHGPEGEYGHPQHQIVHDAVRGAVQMCCNSFKKLHVFEPHTSENHVFSQAKSDMLKLYKSQSRIIFRTFGDWKERIVPFEDYDYVAASSTCRDHQNPKKKVHKFRQCRLHKMFDFDSASDYASLWRTFANQGSGC